MLSPSTAPRWKRTTRVGRPDGLMDGGTAKANRSRNSGSSPMLTRARPPAFTNTRLEIVIVRSCLSGHPAILLSLKLRPAERQPHGVRARLRGIADVGQLARQHRARLLAH